VAATCLLGQQWEYAGIPFGVGRPEVVATDSAYRRRGLIRAIFELIHARSAARGDLAQGITGIPYFYRQFGYEYALDLGGSYRIPLGAVPALPPGAAEPVRLRDATAADLPWVVTLYDRERAHALVSTPIDVGYWRWVLEGMDPAHGQGWRTQVILGAEDRPLGYVLSPSVRWSRMARVEGLAMEPGASLVAVLPAVLRALAAQLPQLPALGQRVPPLDSIELTLGRDHPAYAALGEGLGAVWQEPYAWYVRVPDMPALVRRIGPALEQRLADSVAAGHSGELALDFYRGGLRLVFEGGRLTAAEDWERPEWGSAQAGFPPLVFLQLLFGHRSLDELRRAFPDVQAEDEALPLLRILFPRLPSFVRSQE
jgi:hypothetical protein